MGDPFDQNTFKTGREKLLLDMSFTTWFMDIVKASIKSRIWDTKLNSRVLDINLATLLLLESEKAATLFEQFFSVSCISPSWYHAV